MVMCCTFNFYSFFLIPTLVLRGFCKKLVFFFFLMFCVRITRKQLMARTNTDYTDVASPSA